MEPVRTSSGEAGSAQRGEALKPYHQTTASLPQEYGTVPEEEADRGLWGPKASEEGHTSSAGGFRGQDETGNRSSPLPEGEGETYRDA